MHVGQAFVEFFQDFLVQEAVVQTDVHISAQAGFFECGADVAAAQVEGVEGEPAAEGALEALGAVEVVAQEVVDERRQQADFFSRVEQGEKPAGLLQDAEQEAPHPQGRMHGGGHAARFDAVWRKKVEFVEAFGQFGQHGLREPGAETEPHQAKPAFTVLPEDVFDDEQQVFLGEGVF